MKFEKCTCAICGETFEGVLSDYPVLTIEGKSYCRDCLKKTYSAELAERFVSQDPVDFVMNYFGENGDFGYETKKELCQVWLAWYLEKARGHSSDCDEWYLKDYCMDDLNSWGCWLREEEII